MKGDYVMKKLIRISSVFMAISLLLLSVSCSKVVNHSKIKNGSGIFIDCSEYVSESDNHEHDSESIYGQEVASSIRFKDIDELKQFTVIQDFNDIQKAQLRSMSDKNSKVELPDINNIFCISFGGKDGTDYIEWFGSDLYYFINKTTFNDKIFEYTYCPATDVEMVEDFINEKDNMSKQISEGECEKDTYTKNGVKYTSFSVKNILGYDSMLLYWTYSHGGNKYWVYESINHTDDPELKYSEYEYRRILVENSLGYSWVQINEELPFEITPEFLDQFEFYSINFNA